MSAPLFTFVPGHTPLLIDVPHAGTYIPPDLRATMTSVAQTTPDTDWHVHLLYEFALLSGAGILTATHSRYVVDLNRNPDGVELYPGLNNTELCPVRTFAGDDIYLPGLVPDAAQIAARRERYWTPYHERLRQELAAIRAHHGYAVLLDAHSIRQQVPRLFEGALPDLNLGTAGGTSCETALERRARDALGSAGRFSLVLNGRFKGGHVTRHYGSPGSGIHALQLEIAQSAYMDEAPPYAWQPLLAEPLIEVLRGLVSALLGWRGT